jgi:TetR/AcrR family transcriptional regulator
LIHYYFRSRDLLFQVILKEALSDMHHGFISTAQQKKPIKEKLVSIIKELHSQTMEYPYLQVFAISQLNIVSETQKDLTSNTSMTNVISTLVAEIKEGMNKGDIPKMDPYQFFSNLMSLTIYPSLARPLMKTLFNMDETAYDKFLNSRFKVIEKTLFQT